MIAILTSCRPTPRPCCNGGGGGGSAAPSRPVGVKQDYVAADVDFTQGMIGHHAMALAMALLVPTRTAGGEMLTLAEGIVTAQRAEIKEMQHWLHARGLHTPQVDSNGNVTHSRGHMMGMMSPDELEQLRNASGVEFDRLFLTQMIVHHAGAVTMVDRLFASPGAAQDQHVRAVASEIKSGQQPEIEWMKRLLAALPAAKL